MTARAGDQLRINNCRAARAVAGDRSAARATNAVTLTTSCRAQGATAEAAASAADGPGTRRACSWRRGRWTLWVMRRRAQYVAGAAQGVDHRRTLASIFLRR